MAITCYKEVRQQCKDPLLHVFRYTIEYHNWSIFKVIRMSLLITVTTFTSTRCLENCMRHYHNEEICELKVETSRCILIYLTRYLLQTTVFIVKKLMRSKEYFICTGIVDISLRRSSERTQTVFFFCNIIKTIIDSRVSILPHINIVIATRDTLN